MITIYHNPRCSKSRQALEILEQSSVKYRIVEYLKEPIASDILSQAFQKLGMKLLRVKDQAFKELNLDVELESIQEQDFIDLIDKNPKLLERPLIVKDKKFLIARPPEEILNFL